ncbi:MAG: hypothetical protein GXO23_03605 [Crenarchaeota archaeon]|nr:hypothetical protein [Thermoproteota archaeon]
MVKITLDYKCPICGNNLILLEKKMFVEIQCPRCGIGLRESKREIERNMKERDRLNWSNVILRLVLDFYYSTPTILKIRGICKFDKGAHVLKNIG